MKIVLTLALTREYTDPLTLEEALDYTSELFSDTDLIIDILYPDTVPYMRYTGSAMSIFYLLTLISLGYLEGVKDCASTI